MDAHESPDPGSRGSQASQLKQLLECEQELATLLDEARAQARRLVEAARTEAAAAASDLDAALAQESERAREEIRKETDRQVRALVQEARERAARFEDVAGDGVDALAESAFRRLITGGRTR